MYKKVIGCMAVALLLQVTGCTATSPVQNSEMSAMSLMPVAVRVVDEQDRELSPDKWMVSGFTIDGTNWRPNLGNFIPVAAVKYTVTQEGGVISEHVYSGHGTPIARVRRAYSA